MTMYYAGIGSRTTPQDVCNLMTRLAVSLEAKGYKLRSGGADGADKAFERGVRDTANKEIFRPKDATIEAIQLASEVHPAWHHCNDYARRLHGRNSQIILGRNLDVPVKFVICWTPKGNEVGGTALGMRLATKRGITVYNLADGDDAAHLIKEFLDGNVG